MNTFNEETRAIRTMMETCKMGLKHDPENMELQRTVEILARELEDRIRRL